MCSSGCEDGLDSKISPTDVAKGQRLPGPLVYYKKGKEQRVVGSLKIKQYLFGSGFVILLVGLAICLSKNYLVLPVTSITSM